MEDISASAWGLWFLGHFLGQARGTVVASSCGSNHPGCKGVPRGGAPYARALIQRGAAGVCRVRASVRQKLSMESRVRPAVDKTNDSKRAHSARMPGGAGWVHRIFPRTGSSSALCRGAGPVAGVWGHFRMYCMLCTFVQGAKKERRRCVPARRARASAQLPGTSGGRAQAWAQAVWSCAARGMLLRARRHGLRWRRSTRACCRTDRSRGRGRHRRPP